VGLVLHVYEGHDRAKRLRQLGHRARKSGAKVEASQELLVERAAATRLLHVGGHGFDVAILELDLAAAPLADAEERVAADGEEPPPSITAWLERVPRPIRT